VQQLDGKLIFSATDLINYLECPHLTHLDIEIALGRLNLTETRSDTTELVARKGDEHEQSHLAQLRSEGREIVEIESPPGLHSTPEGAQRTAAAMRAGAEVIYQGVLFDGIRWRGHSDFLQRVESPSELGAFSYEVSDTKLAHRVKPYFLLQLCFYSELLASIQGTAPARMHVVLGTREVQAFAVADFAAYYRAVKHRFEAVLVAPLATTYPEPVEHCGLCRWEEHCIATREADEHLSLVANIRRSQRTRLVEQGITTVPQLAAAEPADRPQRIASATFERLRTQAKLQLAQRTTGEPRYELLAPADDRGFARLPQPSEGDVFFDMEGDPFFDDGLEYLFGVVLLEPSGPRFQAFWATDRATEKQAFSQFVGLMIKRLQRHPDMHIYHYASYEATAIKRLMGLHATCEDEVDHLLRGKVLVDLHTVVRQALLAGQPNYSIKSIEAFYMDKRDTEVTAGGDSIVAFERFLETGDRSLLESIERYNEDDCRSTHLLREWLLARRIEAIGTFGREIQWKPPPDPYEPDPDVEDQLDELQTALLDGVPEDTTGQDSDQHARWLTAQLLDYHRREAKPAWWAYFERLEADDQQLIEADTEALGGLSGTGDPPAALPPPSRSVTHTLRFPVQEHKISKGSFTDPAAEKSVTVLSVDDATGIVQISRGAQRMHEPLPRALIPSGPYDTRLQRSALRDFANDITARGLDAQEEPFTALRQILRRDVPTTSARPHGAALQTGAFDLDDAKSITEGLRDSYLFIQGPPGSGKTYTGAQLILHLIERGHRVGVAAGSHSAIHTLLHQVEQYALAESQFSGLNKYSEDDNRYSSGRGLIENSKDPARFTAGSYNLMAGTAWLWCREEMRQSVDYLFIDEAGQISLADALAMGTCARNLLLLGDPQQLAQVSQAIHPPGAGSSVLEHLLRQDTTIPGERGLFIDQTRRMHPDVCRFISEAMYEGRLESAPECAAQRIDAPGLLTGTGVRYVPVTHEGNTRSSVEEARTIATLTADLLKGDYTKQDGTCGPLQPEDIMVVAPYNAQVRCLREHLPDGVRIGTVDKFQGQEAAVCFFSMATSSGEEIPRHLEFLFSRNRLNVAVSRARAQAVLVCSPELLHIRCRNADQMRLLNALCLLVESASAASTAEGMA
jgi:predicted RecB family nuclease